MNTVLKIEHLNKSFGKRRILHDISLETYEGEVFGFLGPNGAGKTTTLKIAVGLLSLNEGNITINGKSLKTDFEGALSDVGGIVENPEFYDYMTGMQNIQQYARLRGGISDERINEVISMVGLANYAKYDVKKYSLGMRQRLGIAQALLHKPKLLILDEPTNGLDPAGIRGLRDMLKELAHKEKISVIVSSHLMSEMELMCDRVGIITNGVMQGVYSIEEILSSAKGNLTEYHIRVSSCEKAIEVLDFIEPQNKSALDDKHISVKLDRENAEEELFEVTAKLVTKGIRLGTVAPIENNTLEDVFLKLTNSGGGQIG